MSAVLAVLSALASLARSQRRVVWCLWLRQMSEIVVGLSALAMSV